MPPHSAAIPVELWISRTTTYYLCTPLPFSTLSWSGRSSLTCDSISINCRLSISGGNLYGNSLSIWQIYYICTYGLFDYDRTFTCLVQKPAGKGDYRMIYRGNRSVYYNLKKAWQFQLLALAQFWSVLQLFALYPWHAVCGMWHAACSSIVHWPFSRNVVWGSWRRIPIRTVPGTFSLLMLLPDGEREEERERKTGDSRSDVLDYVRILTAKSK